MDSGEVKKRARGSWNIYSCALWGRRGSPSYWGSAGPSLTFHPEYPYDVKGGSQSSPFEKDRSCDCAVGSVFGAQKGVRVMRYDTLSTEINSNVVAGNAVQKSFKIQNYKLPLGSNLLCSRMHCHPSLPLLEGFLREPPQLCSSRPGSVRCSGHDEHARHAEAFCKWLNCGVHVILECNDHCSRLFRVHFLLIKWSFVPVYQQNLSMKV